MLRPNKAVEGRNIGLAGNVSRVRARRGPVQAQLFAGPAEDRMDVGRSVRERISRPGPASSAGVLKPTAVRVDEATDELFGPAVDELLLPVSELYTPLVLLTGPVLREETGPASPVGRNLDAVLGPRLD